MTISSRQLQEWLNSREDEHLEFKEARNNFHFEKLVKYCAALANEGGGVIVLGVTDTRPRQIVGSQVFANLERTKAGLIERLRLRIEADELVHPDGRVVVFSAPSRPIGVPIAVEGAYWMRAGEDLVPMTPDMLRRIFDESGPDFSAEICPRATLADLDPEAIAAFRHRWMDRSHNQALANRSLEQLLQDAELLMPEGLTYAALILLGTSAALGRLLAQAEVIFEYRSSPRPGPANQREEFRQGVLLFYDRLWELINLRNDEQHFQDGMVMHSVPTFSEGTVREAILNAVSHRDYRHPGSIFVRQYARRVEIVSPGGFPPGITPENILDQQLPRNRRIAEVLSKCGLVERAGQGFDLMCRECIRQGKLLPDFSRTDTHFVWVTLHGEIQDPKFLRYLEEVGQERMASFNTEDFLLIDLIHREQSIPDYLKSSTQRLLEQGVIERVSRGRSARYLLSQRFYRMLGQSGTYTQSRSLDRETNKELLLQHIRERGSEGAAFADFTQVLPGLSRRQIQRLILKLRLEGLIDLKGARKGAKWFSVSR